MSKATSELKAREDLIVRAMNRKYPQKEPWRIGQDPDGCLIITGNPRANKQFVIPEAIFVNSPSALKVWDWVVKTIGHRLYESAQT